VPKHSVLMPLLAAPFRALFGTSGFLVFNLLQMFALVYGVAVLAGDSPPARVLALTGFLLSPLVLYSYNFSPDVLGAALVVWTYVAAVRKRWMLAGVFAGLAVWAKVYLAVVMLPVGLLVMAAGWRGVLPIATGAVIALAPMFATNTALYGSPFATGYDLEAVVHDDRRIATSAHYSRFNQPILTGLGSLLFDGRIGLAWTAPVWSLWPVGAWYAWKKGARRLTTSLVSGLVANLLIIAPYDEWNASMVGNRFLFPALALGVAVQGRMWEAVLTHRRRSSGERLESIECGASK